MDSSWHYHPPGYHYVLHFLLQWCGDSEFVLRFPSAVAGTVAIPVIFLVGARFYSHREGLMAAGLLAFLMSPIYYSQEARPYSGLILLVLISTLLWSYLYDSLKRNEKPLYWAALYSVTALLTCYWHYFGLLIVTVQGASLFFGCLTNRRALCRVLFMYSFLVVGYLPWIPTMLRQLSGSGPAHPKPQASLGSLWYDYLQYCLNDLWWVSAGSSVVILVLFVRWSRRMLRAKSQEPGYWDALVLGIFLFAWLVLPFLFSYLKSMSSASVYTTRNLLVSLPALYLLISRGVMSLPIRPVVTFTAVGAFLCYAVYHLLFVANYYERPHKGQFRDMVQHVLSQEETTEKTLLIGWGFNPDPFDYYLARLGSNRRVDAMAGLEAQVSEIEKLLTERDPDYVWYLYYTPAPDEVFVASLKKQMRLVEETQFNGFLGSGLRAPYDAHTEADMGALLFARK
jgi:uncharacterized membrane protein